MGRPRKINVNELRETKGNILFNSENVETTKNVKEIIAQERVSPELKSEVISKDEVSVANKFVVHGAIAPDQANSINNILKKFRKDLYVRFSNEPREYSAAIKKMSLSELHAHAIDVSVIPTSDKEKLIKNLENAFGVYINKQIPRTFPANLSAQASKNIEEIISKKLGKKL